MELENVSKIRWGKVVAAGKGQMRDNLPMLARLSAEDESQLKLEVQRNSMTLVRIDMIPNMN